jgi:hypothetical protein
LTEHCDAEEFWEDWYYIYDPATSNQPAEFTTLGEAIAFVEDVGVPGLLIEHKGEVVYAVD